MELAKLISVDGGDDLTAKARTAILRESTDGAAGI